MPEEKFKQIVRLANSDLDGNKSVIRALRKINGISFMMSNAICIAILIDDNKKAGDLTQVEIKKIEDVIANPMKYNIPDWLLNRRKDFETGQNIHLTGSQLKLVKEFDIKRMRRTKSYKGMRHSYGLPVRGQRTKGHFRTGRTIGVQKKKLKAAMAAGAKGKKSKDEVKK